MLLPQKGEAGEGGAGEAKPPPSEVSGFDFDVLRARKPALAAELDTFRDHLVAGSSQEEVLKVWKGPGGREWGRESETPRLRPLARLPASDPCSLPCCPLRSPPPAPCAPQVWDLKDLGLAAAQRVASASDPLRLLREVSQNFPALVESLSRAAVTPELRWGRQGVAGCPGALALLLLRWCSGGTALPEPFFFGFKSPPRGWACRPLKHEANNVGDLD